MDHSIERLMFTQTHTTNKVIISEWFHKFQKLTSSFHEGFVEFEGEKWLRKVSEEVFKNTCNNVDVFYFVKRWQSLSSNQLLLQVFNLALLARDSVQANLCQRKEEGKKQVSLSGSVIPQDWTR